MRPTRRVIRRLPPPSPTSFDDQVWPVQAALIVLGAFLLGIALSVCRFDELRPWRNSVTWLTAIPLLVAASVWAVTRVPRQWLRRVVMLSVTISLILNVVLLVVMAGARIFPHAPRDELMVKQQPSVPLQVVVPEYAVTENTAADQVQLQLRQPAAAGVAVESRPAVERQESTSETERTSRAVVPLPAVTPASPATTFQRRLIQTPPRQFTEPSRLARQVRAKEPGAARRVVLPSERPAPASPAASESELAARMRPPNQTTRATDHLPLPAPRRPPSAVAAAPQLAARAAADRRPPDDPQSEPIAAPTLPRRIRQPVTPPHSRRPMVDNLAAAAARTAADAVRPARTSVTRRMPSSEVQLERAESLADTAPSVQSKLTSRDQPDRDQPTLAQTQVPLPTRRALKTRPAPRPLEAEAKQVAAAQSSPTSDVVPTATNVSRQARASWERAPAISPAPQVKVSAADVVQALRDRATRSAVPTIAAEVEPAAQPRRAIMVAPSAVSPRKIASAMATERAEASREPALEPSATALSRAELGMAGVGKSADVARTAVAVDGQAYLATAARKRSVPTQQLPAELAIAPSLPARQPQAAASRQLPATPMAAQPLDARHGPNPAAFAQIDATASAALRHAVSNADLAKTTGAVGESEFDFGPRRLVTKGGRSRGEGGGQPELNTTANTMPRARRQDRAAPTAALMAAAPGDVPRAPAAQGGGQPDEAAADPGSLAIRRSATGGEAILAEGPSRQPETGLPQQDSAVDLLAAPTLPRASPLAADEGPAEPGGKEVHDRMRREAPPPALALAADRVQVPTEKESSGIPGAMPLVAQGTRRESRAPGVELVDFAAEVGTLEGPQPVAAHYVQPADVTSRRRASFASADQAPSFADGATALPRRPEAIGRSRSSPAAVENVELSSPPDAVAADADGGDPLVAGFTDGPVLRQRDGALELKKAAPDGDAGWGLVRAMDSGVPDRRALQDSVQLSPHTIRFVRSDVGGPRAINAKPAKSAEAFRQRLERREQPGAGAPGRPSQKTEEAIERGLVFLARHQSPDGRWSLNDFVRDEEAYQREVASLRSDTAATGLALLAFLGAGYHHREDDYQQTVRAGLDYLLRHQADDGNLFVPEDANSNRSAALYSHAIASLALTEAYGMTQDSQLREPAQQAIEFIVAAQDQRHGGWRYTPGLSSDTSVSGWMMMALKSAELAGLGVSPSVYAGIERWLDAARASENEPYLFRYNPFAPDTERQRHGRMSNPVMTSVGLLMQLYSGWRRHDPEMVKGATYLLEHPPTDRSNLTGKRDTYYWYYATQVLFHMGGDYWEQWNARLHPLLIKTQVAAGPLAGSWDPLAPIPDRWGPQAGRIYVTTMNLLSLEVYYRHLPIYEDTAR